MELIDVFDGNYNLIGTEERDIVHEKGLWHQTFHCWVIRPNGKMVKTINVMHENFMPRTKWLWLKIFIMAERYLNGEKYLAV